MFGGGEIVGGLIMGLIILIDLFLILREVACWYWKINERIELQQRQNALLERLLSRQEGTFPEKEKHEILEVDTICTRCMTKNTEDDIFCSNCGTKL